MALKNENLGFLSPLRWFYYSIQIHFLISLAEITNYIYII